MPPADVVWRAGTSNRVLAPVRQAGNRFLGSVKGVQIWALLLTFSTVKGRHGLPGFPGRQGEKGEPMILTPDEKQFFRGSPGPR
jgi:hypothetical protein